jgi:hypothetical protein
MYVSKKNVRSVYECTWVRKNESKKESEFWKVPFSFSVYLEFSFATTAKNPHIALFPHPTPATPLAPPPLFANSVRKNFVITKFALRFFF